MNQTITESLTKATGRALATNGVHGMNVIPVSSLRVVGETIQLYDFFMRKTVENIASDDEVALACWNGFVGVQVRARATYIDHGDVFDEANGWAKQTFPERTLKGVLVLQPTAAFDVSVSLEAPGAPLTLVERA